MEKILIKVKLIDLIDISNSLEALILRKEEDLNDLFDENVNLETNLKHKEELSFALYEYSKTKDIIHLENRNPLALNYLQMLRLSSDIEKLKEQWKIFKSDLNKNETFLYSETLIGKMFSNEETYKKNICSGYDKKYFSTIDQEVSFPKNVFLNTLEIQENM